MVLLTHSGAHTPVPSEPTADLLFVYACVRALIVETRGLVLCIIGQFEMVSVLHAIDESRFKGCLSLADSAHPTSIRQ